MLYLVVLVCISVVSSQIIPSSFQGMNSDMTPPSFCHGLDCPRYTLIKQYQGYEVRRYEASRWVATNKTTMEYTDQDRREMFFRLFHYISGNNTQDLKIPMTSPVLTKVSHGPGPTCESDFFMYFMIPFNMQANTPKPTDSKAYIVDMPQMDVFVKSFGGRPSEDDKIHQLELLASEIVDVNQFESSFFFTAGYDGPYTLNRHNEVWLAKI